MFLEAVEINPVVVHGGGKAITRAMEKAGLKAQFVQGQRVTDEATVQVVDEVLSREINPEVVATINSLGGVARGFAGHGHLHAAASWLDDRTTAARSWTWASWARWWGEHGAAAGVHRAGHHAGHQPHRPRRGRPASTTATRTWPPRMAAIALKAKRLVFMSDVPGLMRDPKDPATVIPHLRIGEVRRAQTSRRSWTRA